MAPPPGEPFEAVFTELGLPVFIPPARVETSKLEQRARAIIRIAIPTFPIALVKAITFSFGL
jgi:hypothetical protein